MSFREVQFPTDIAAESGLVGGPEWRTEIVELVSGAEKRNAAWANPRHKWDVATGIKTKTQLQSLKEFFQVMQGKLIGFRFKDWMDYEGTYVEIGTGTGAQTEYQIVKIYNYSLWSYSRTITKPVSGSLSVYVDDVPQVYSTEYDFSTTTGIITFQAGAIPGAGAVINATFEFDVPVRFDTDVLKTDLSHYLAGSFEVPIIEIRV